MGLPFFMGGFSMIAIAVTSATVAIFGVVIADPIALLNRIGGTGTTMLAITGLLLSTLTTNIAANVVGPANAVVNLSPGRVNFATGGLVTAGIGAAIMPWKLLADGYVRRTNTVDFPCRLPWSSAIVFSLGRGGFVFPSQRDDELGDCHHAGSGPAHRNLRR
jgi:cytosine/uracil/thiamine/allantoin permease